MINIQDTLNHLTGLLDRLKVLGNDSFLPETKPSNKLPDRASNLIPTDLGYQCRDSADPLGYNLGGEGGARPKQAVGFTMSGNPYNVTPSPVNQLPVAPLACSSE